MKKESREFLGKLIATISPSGFEEEAARVWQAEARTFAASVKHDCHGNSHAVVNPGGSPRIMFAGHYDEIGFLITHIDDKGFLWLGPLGGWDPQIPQGHRVLIRGRKGRVPGVIGKAPVHLIKPEEREKVTKLERLWVDIGVGSRKEAEKFVAIGDPLVLDHEMASLQGDIVVGRGFDNKVGAFVVLEAARRLAKMNPAAEIHAVGTVQEEIGLRGGRTAAFGIDPQIGIAVDLYFATDNPGTDDQVRKLGKLEVGKGAILTRGPNIHPKLFALLQQTAERKKIAHQVQAQSSPTGTDANAIQVSRAGVITGLVSVPNRYMHSSCELCSLADMDAAINLIAEACAKIDDRTDLRLF